MTGKFDAVHVEEDTLLVFSTEAKLGDYDVLYQKWIWEGIEAESFIFASADVAALSDDALESLARSSPMIGKESRMTLKRESGGFDFVNFNFRVLDDDD